MSKNRKNLRAKIARSLVSVLVLAVVFLPVLLTVKWLGGVTGDRDPRRVVTVQTLQTRAIDQNPQPVRLFDEPLITVTFDDGWESIYANALPVLQKHGIKTTQYVLSGEFDNYSYMSVAQMKSMQAAGHEMGSHTISHADLTMLDDHQLAEELGESKHVLSDHLGQIEDFTSPYGAYNSHTLEIIGKYYRSQKNAEGDPSAQALDTINTKSNFNPLNIKSYSIRNTTTLADIERLIAATKENKAWLVITYHQVDYSGGLYAVTPSQFDQQMHLIAAAQTRLPTVDDVLDVWYEKL